MVYKTLSLRKSKPEKILSQSDVRGTSVIGVIICNKTVRYIFEIFAKIRIFTIETSGLLQNEGKWLNFSVLNSKSVNKISNVQ